MGPPFRCGADIRRPFVLRKKIRTSRPGLQPAESTPTAMQSPDQPMLRALRKQSVNRSLIRSAPVPIRSFLRLRSVDPGFEVGHLQLNIAVRERKSEAKVSNARVGSMTRAFTRST